MDIYLVTKDLSLPKAKLVVISIAKKLFIEIEKFQVGVWPG